MKTALIIVSFIISFSAKAQDDLIVRTSFTNHHPAHSWRDRIYLHFEMPLDYKPAKVKIIDNINGVSTTDTLHKKDLVLNKLKQRSYYYDLGKAKDIYTLHLVSISLLDSIGNELVSETITAKDQKNLGKAYGISMDASQKGKLTEFRKTGNTQGELMGNNEDIRIVKRETCIDKKKRYRKDGVNGNKEMTTGF